MNKTLTALAATLLAGCSALQIDVDVYTGRLDNNPELQAQQYLTLAVAAQPLLDDIRVQSNASADAQRVALGQMLGGIAAIYEGERGLSGLADQIANCPVRDLNPHCRTTLDNANRKVLSLATQLLQAANMFRLGERSAGHGAARKDTDKQALDDDVVALQSLGNTLMVHARDLDRQRQHTDVQNAPERVTRDRREQEVVLAALDGLNLDDPGVAVAALPAALPASSPAPVRAPASASTSASASASVSTRRLPTRAEAAPAAVPAAPAALPAAPPAPATITNAEAGRQLLKQSGDLALPQAVAETIRRNNQTQNTVLGAAELPVWAQREVEKAVLGTSISDGDRQDALAAVAALDLRSDGSLCSDGRRASPHLLCGRQARLDQADQFIHSLRLRRVEALARGRTLTAEALQKAINAASDSRTAMIYLRPASDYLRSVYTASAYQQAQAQRYRNMLTEWVRFLPTNSERRGPLAEIDKLAWQNINTVSVSGGGNTNYVLAKDDVGNWYVKAYAADPEPIIRAATSLVLYNTGARLQQNLLGRLQDQRRLDDPATPASEKDRLRTALQQPATDAGAGETLLRLRAQQVARYQQEMRSDARKLADELLAHRGSAQAAAAGVATPAPAACKPADLARRALSGTPADTLQARRIELLDSERRLETALGLQASAAATAESLRSSQQALERLEDDHGRALAALLGYADALSAVFAPTGNEGCDDGTRVRAADAARKASRSRTLAAAHARRDSLQAFTARLEELNDAAATP